MNCDQVPGNEAYMLASAAPRVRGGLLAAMVACCAVLGCASSAPSRASLLVGVCQEGGEPTTRSDGRPLLSEAYLVRGDGEVVIHENYGDVPSERALRTSAARARKLIELLSSPSWQALASEPKAPPLASDDVKVTIEIEGKSVTRWSSRQEPIFREVLGTLAEIRSGGT